MTLDEMIKELKALRKVAPGDTEIVLDIRTHGEKYTDGSKNTLGKEITYVHDTGRAIVALDDIDIDWCEPGDPMYLSVYFKGSVSLNKWKFYNSQHLLISQK